MHLLRALWTVALVTLPACNGLLVFDPDEVVIPCVADGECLGGQVCVSDRCRSIETVVPCSVVTPEGDCPPGFSCQQGICLVTSGGSGWCECNENEGCNNGQCIALEEDPCTPFNPNGLCPNQNLCVLGSCVPCEQGSACSPSRPNGCCAPGSACDGGFCKALNVVPACSAQNPDGVCNPGEDCIGGSCQPAQCSTSAPLGYCVAPDTVCRDGNCEPLDCSPQYTNGQCPTGTNCSGAGNCLPDGQCDVTDDCVVGNFCSATGMCIPNGTCAANDDCQVFFECAQGGTCVRDLSCDDGSECMVGEFCSISTPRTCFENGACRDASDCAAGQFCSESSACIPDGTCAVDQDCNSGEFCGVSGACVQPGQCVVNDDCLPGRTCTELTPGSPKECKVPVSNQCTTNISQSATCGAGETCCSQGFRCGELPTVCGACGGAGQPACPPDCARACILDGQCITNADCLSSYYTCQNNQCQPVTTCFADSDCGAGERCSIAGACLPVNNCVADNDCPTAVEVCDALFQCETGGCSTEQPDTELVQPNLLAIIDRSGSMARTTAGSNSCSADANYPDGIVVNSLAPSRWNIARDALAQVMNDNINEIYFGLQAYPHYCPGIPVCGITSCSGCTSNCDWNAACNSSPYKDSQTECDAFYPCRWVGGGTPCVPRFASDATGNNRVPGTADVVVGANKVGEIITSLRPPGESGKSGAAGPQYPGGYTPTDRAVREVLQDRGKFGLPLPAETKPRANYIMLMTDGAANWSSSSYGDGCDDSATVDSFYPGSGIHVERTNCALNKLTMLVPPINTYVVGFAGGDKRALNCNAVWGGTSRCGTPAQCSALGADESTCNATTGCSWSGTACQGGIDSTNCNTESFTCYYQADDAAQLLAAFRDIAGSVASCSFSLSKQPSSPDQLFVYVDYEPGNPANDPGTPLGTNTSDPDGYWQYDDSTVTVEFFGKACDDIQAGTAVPAVIFGCGGSGG